MPLKAEWMFPRTSNFYEGDFSYMWAERSDCDSEGVAEDGLGSRAGSCDWKEGQACCKSEAMGHVAGFAITNDVSERDFQIERQGQWTKGKSSDNFAQIGPWLVTPDEIEDPQNLKMWLRVNGKTMQNGCTATMVYGVEHLVSYLSDFMTLYPGDIISTGTPPGVGLGQKPPRYLKAGDRVELSIEGLGSQQQEVVNE